MVRDGGLSIGVRLACLSSPPGDILPLCVPFLGVGVVVREDAECLSTSVLTGVSHCQLYSTFVYIRNRWLLAGGVTQW